MRLTDTNRRFSPSILNLLIEDSHTAHVERVNNNNKFVVLIVGDIVMTRTVIQSNLSTNRVATLRYQTQEPFRIVKRTGRGSYFVRKLYTPDSPELKSMVTYLYPLYPSLKPSKPVDSSDIRYLNQSYSPIVNLLSKPINIELYNETWFDKPPRISQPLFDYNHPTLAFLEPHLTKKQKKLENLFYPILCYDC